ncbi:MAG: hypothetical protein GY842_24620 [bacterium]|nr:hypothetical protein [bacterium]
MTYLIDGNNLLHAAPHHLPGPAVGRQRLSELLGWWSRQVQTEVTVVFDGAEPRPSLAAQMRASGIDLLFSSPRTADEVIEDIIATTRYPAQLCVVSGDRAIQSVARRHRCTTMDSGAFARELAALLAPRKDDAARLPASTPPEKPESVSREEADEWMREFDVDSTPSEDTPLSPPGAGRP